ncbi:MAG: BrnT family toxin [Spirochaetaceae bacterium]
MRFEWDPRKEETNRRKHAVSFSEAREVFDDPLHLSVLDARFSYYEERWITIGTTSARRLVVVAHLYFDEEDEEVIRIISAREATINERRQYES